VTQQFFTHGQSLLIGVRQGHGVLQCRRLFKLDISFQRVAEARGEDVNLVFLREALATIDKCQEEGLIIRNCGLPPELNKFSQRVASNGWAEPLVDQLLELIPRWRALVLLEQRKPLRHVARHVEGSQEHLLGVLGGLNVEELGTLVEPGQWVDLPIICGKQELVVVASHCGDLVTVGRTAPVTHLGELVGLQAIDSQRQLSLVALHHGHGRVHVVDDAQRSELFVHGLGLGLGRW
jgi:hypothetical protein